MIFVQTQLDQDAKNSFLLRNQTILTDMVILYRWQHFLYRFYHCTGKLNHSICSQKATKFENIPNLVSTLVSKYQNHEDFFFKFIWHFQETSTLKEFFFPSFSLFVISNLKLANILIKLIRIKMFLKHFRNNSS